MPLAQRLNIEHTFIVTPLTGRRWGLHSKGFTRYQAI
jgi:hypothetical protein